MSLGVLGREGVRHPRAGQEGRRLLVGMFAEESGLVGAAAEAHRRGYPILDAYTPYPVHGLDEAMGLRPTRLSRVCLACGVVGAVVAMAFQQWALAVDWPINVGGRPFNSWPAYLPATFEVMVLLAGFGVVFAFLGVSRLFPGKTAELIDPGVTDDRFVLVVDATGSATDVESVLALFRKHGAFASEEREVTRARAVPAARNLRRWNYGLLVALVLMVAWTWSLRRDPAVPNREFMPEMVRPVPYESFAPHPDLPNKMTMQPPLEGTIARGHLPLHYQATPEDAVRAGLELSNLFAADDDKFLRRGAEVYANHCQVCHGPGGMGDGPVSKRGVPPPPSLLAEKAVKMRDGQIFHVITYGQANMAAYAAQVPTDDRWAVILHVRTMQKSAASKQGGKQ